MAFAGGSLLIAVFVADLPKAVLAGGMRLEWYAALLSSVSFEVVVEAIKAILARSEYCSLNLRL